MELIGDPEKKSTYNTCKYRVKLWEHEFKKKYGRLPSKLDIREAEKEVRLAYKTYFNLKSAALEQSFIDVDGFQSDEETRSSSTIELDLTKENSQELFDRFESLIHTEETASSTLKKLDFSEDNSQELLDRLKSVDTLDNINTDKTWGEHLNNRKDEHKTKKKQEKSTVNLSFSQKLYDRSKFSKRNPRKSLSFHHRKSESNFPESKSLSQPTYSASCLESCPADEPSMNKLSLLLSRNASLENLLNPGSCTIISGKNRANTQPVNVIHCILDNEYKPREALDVGWVNRVAQKTGTDIESDNVNIEDFACSRECIKEKATKFDSDSDDVIENSDDESQLSQSVLHTAKKIRTDWRDNQSDSTMTKNLNKSEDAVPVKSAKKLNELNNIKNNSESEVKKGRKKLAKNSGKKAVFQQENTENGEPRQKRKSARFKKIVNLKEDSDSDKDPYESQKEEDRIDKGVTRKGTRTKKTVENESETRDIDVPVYELEYSVQPRIMTVPRIQSQVKKINLKTKGQSVKDKSEQAKDKLEKKIKSGNLNENFVKVNLKKKVFVRGKKTLNFGKYKKQMWKNKKKMLNSDGAGFDGESLTCFNCGQIGHFARQCPNAKGDDLLPLSAVDDAENDDCHYPTLEEAAQIAQESVLAIRKPNISSVNENSNSTELNPGNLESADFEDFEEASTVAFEDSEYEEDFLTEVLHLEQYVAQLDMKQYMDFTSVVKPYYESDNIEEVPSEVLDTLRMFGHNSFRSGQEHAIMRILAGKSTLVTLSTGSGKSLCYQLPAYLYSQREPCLSLVISPLVSLMEDQVTGIPQFLKAACLHTNQTKSQREKIMEVITSGNLNILLVSPEAIVAGERTTGFSSILRKLPPIAFACIDEAHCVSQWSHNFRPSYLMICRILRESLGVNTILGLTATATKSTSDSIIHHLQIPDGQDGIISDMSLPDNLRLTISSDFNRDQALLALLLSERFVMCKSIIVYCTRRDECERIATFLRTSLKNERQVSEANKKRKRFNAQAEPYHAGLSASRRKSIQKAFMSGELRIVVATVAFGMGINKSNIRAVIHYNMPSSFESYVQEVGRAGRDGLPAHCHLFLDSQGKDENELRRHIHANSMDRHVIRKLLQKIFMPCACTTKCPKHEVAFSIQETVQVLDLPEESISTLLCYLELHDNRYIQVLSPAYTICKVISYAGVKQIKQTAKDCPPLAMALALCKKSDKDETVFEFPIVEVASAMGWDSGICKHKLKNLEWTTVNNQPKRSSLSVQFSNLGFRLLAPGNLPDSELDNALDSLHQRVIDQERKCLLQLHALSTTVNAVAQKTYKLCISDEVTEEEKKLKDRIRLYFESPNPLNDSVHLEDRPVNDDVIASDTRSLVCMYRDTVFTGRAVARVFHGIQSPNFPAFIWGRCKFWRAHVHEDFHAVCKIATREILKMR